jgi:hypothetical protein
MTKEGKSNLAQVVLWSLQLLAVAPVSRHLLCGTFSRWLKILRSARSASASTQQAMAGLSVRGTEEAIPTPTGQHWRRAGPVSAACRNGKKPSGKQRGNGHNRGRGFPTSQCSKPLVEYYPLSWLGSWTQGRIRTFALRGADAVSQTCR